MAVKAIYLGKAIVKVIVKQYALSAIFWPILKSNDLKRHAIITMIFQSFETFLTLKTLKFYIME